MSIKNAMSETVCGIDAIIMVDVMGRQSQQQSAGTGASATHHSSAVKQEPERFENLLTSCHCCAGAEEELTHSNSIKLGKNFF
jgi:hypothetical protein